MDYENITFEPEPIKHYTITLADGKIIDNLTLNGNNFVSQTEIKESIFDNNLSTVTIKDDLGGEEVHHDMALVQVVHYTMEGIEPGWYFILRDVPEEERMKDKLRSDVDYIAMMTDVDI